MHDLVIAVMTLLGSVRLAAAQPTFSADEYGQIRRRWNWTRNARR
jgi:hypothetical protein